MAREIVLGTVHKYDWTNIAGAIQHPEKGKVISISDAIRKETGVPDANVILYPVDGYGNEDILYAIIDREKPTAIMIFTDPRFWIWFFAIERQLRKKYPVVFLNIWDCVPSPVYNRPYYESVDSLFSISKQTYNINKMVLGPENCITMDGYFDKDGKEILNKIGE